MSEKEKPSAALRRVATGDLCSGCGACAAIAPRQIEMELSPPGFLRPRQSGTVSADEDARIFRVCPGLGQSVEAAGRMSHPLWGPYLEMRSGWARDADLRHRGSSGGALSALLVWLVDSGRVAGALTNGADPGRAVANVPVIVRSREEVAEAAGSRYAPSAPLAALGTVPDDGRPYAFVGKPCDAAAFRALSETRPDLETKFPVILSFFCAGVPALAGAEAVLSELGTAPDEVVSFRYRGHGWPGRATAVLSDGTDRSMSYHESWGGILSSRVQHRCKICADGTGVAADIVCADAWETDARGYPLFEEQDGVSLIVARTPKGADLLAAAEAAGAIVTQPFDVARLAAMQPGQTRRRQALPGRLAALRLLGRPVPRYRGLDLGAAARTGSVRWVARNFLGMLRRGMRGKRF